MSLRKLYDETDPRSIENYSLGLINKSVEEILYDYFGDTKEYLEIHKKIIELGKSADFGKIIEEFYFGNTANRHEKTIFPEAKIELKVLPYNQSPSGRYNVKGDMIIDIIPESALLTESYYETHILAKLKLILLVLYHGEKSQHDITHKIGYSKLLSLSYLILEKDRDIIKSDFNFIVDKIKRGRIHEITETDTTCLFVSSPLNIDEKNLDSDKINEQKLKKDWLFTLKKNYISVLINDYIRENMVPYEVLSSDRVTVKEFEEIIKSKIMAYKGRSEKELQEHFKMTEVSSKNIRHMITLKMLGIKSASIEEFVITKTIIKTIKIEKNGTVRESMSFPVMKFKDFVKEKWEESAIYKYFNENRFLFIIYKNNGDAYVLENVKFWHMPKDDLQKIGFSEWKTIQNILKEGVELIPYNGRILNNLPKKSETKMFHLRPHASKSAYLIKGVKHGSGRLSMDCDELPNGDKMTKQSFWLNNNYIQEQIN